MSGIFDLFNGTGNLAKNTSWLDSGNAGPVDSTKKLSMTSMTPGNAGTSAKNIVMPRLKPKGLSIRSKSDLNVTTLGTNAARSPTKKSPIKGQYLTAEKRPFGAMCKQLSPRSKEKNSKLQVLKSKQLKGLSSKSRSPDNFSPSKKMQEENTNLFRKPFTPKNPRKPSKTYREPEKLANFYDEEASYSITDYLDREFVRLVSLSKPPVKPYDDEGFESDPEFIPQPSCEISDNSPVEISLKAPSLPSISDDDDDEDDDFF